MIDCYDCELRLNTHRQRTETINQTRWMVTEAAQPAGGIRQQLASALISLAGKLSSDAAASPVRPVGEPAGSFTS